MRAEDPINDPLLVPSPARTMSATHLSQTYPGYDLHDFLWVALWNIAPHKH